MNVPKEIAEKAEEYEKLKARADQLFEEMEEWANENGYEEFCVDGFGTSQEPEGEEQEEGEYNDLDLWTHGEDGGSGVHYYPIKGSTEYMWVSYYF